jgi:hypothetical protein
VWRKGPAADLAGGTLADAPPREPLSTTNLREKIRREILTGKNMARTFFEKSTFIINTSNKIKMQI